MTEELEQLLKNLKLRRMLEIYAAARRRETGRPLSRVPPPPAARTVAPPPGDRLGISHPARQPARALVAGNLSLRPTARGEPQTDPHFCRTGLSGQGGKYNFHRPHGSGQNRVGFWPCAESPVEWLPLPVHRRARFIR